jgi:PncC family amidohydrolase
MIEPELVALAERLQGRCLARGWTVATAESCTGGLVAHVLTAVPGSSGYVLGALVTYADAVKTAWLDVPVAMLEAHGAVSAQVARAMATAAAARSGAALAVAITGIAGPGGGTPEKPVGLTYVATVGPGGDVVRRCHLEGDRDANRLAATRIALEMLLEATDGDGEATAE